MNRQSVIIRPELITNEIEGEIAGTSASDFLAVVGRQKWKILSFMVVSAAAVAIFTARLQPLYEATAELSIERPGVSSIIGQDGSGNNGPVNDMDQLVTTHIEALRSDAVLRPVAQKYRLLEREGQLKRKSPVQVANIQAAPITLKRLQITRPPNTYMLRVTYRAHDPKLAADVANGIAEIYVEHSADAQAQMSVDRASVMQQELVGLRAKIAKSEAALTSLERHLSFNDSEAHVTTLETRYAQLSTELAAAQEERIRKGEAFTAVRTGALGAAQASTQSEALSKAIDRLAEARQKFAQTKAIYGTNHPEYRKAANEVTELSAQLDEMRGTTVKRVESEYSQSVAHEQALTNLLQNARAELDQTSPARHKYNQMKRELESDKQLSDEMARRIKEQAINGAFRHGLARISNPALPAAVPVFPNTLLLVVVASMASLMLAIGGALVADAFDQSVLDPEQAARSLRVNFLGALPELTKAAAAIKPGQVPSRESIAHCLSSYEEAIRTVRNTLTLVDFNREHKTIMFTSALPSEGKSITVAHLGHAFALHGRRTLIIDADLRRPAAHKRLGIQPPSGLSGALEGQHSWRDAVVSVPSVPNLGFLAAGVTAVRASDLVTDGISKILDEAAREFDLVLIDAPPLLGFAETLQIGTAVDAVILVSQAGRTPGKLVATALNNLHRVRINVLGLLLTRAKTNSQSYGYGYGTNSYSGRRLETVRPILDKTA
ncbi:MAG: GumC family protein [Bryobacteraceae bacterium]